MLRRGWIKGTKSATPKELLAQFKDVVKGAIITDPALPASKNIATMLASVKGGLVTSAALAKRYGLPVLDDLRGRWTTNVGSYRWAFDNLWPQLNHHVIACLWPDHLGLRDYLVANKVFIFWLSGAIDGARRYASPDAEVRLMEELLSKMPANIPVMGYPWAGKNIGIGEGPGVSLFAEFGKYLVGSIDTTNLTVHSGIRVASLKQMPAPPAPQLDPAKVYVTWIVSDGDNLPVLTSGNFPQLWADKERGQFPIGWTVSPSASMLIPDIEDYYFQHRDAQRRLPRHVSGVGYTYPDLYGKRYADRHRVYDEFLAQTSRYMQRQRPQGRVDHERDPARDYSPLCRADSLPGGDLPRLRPLHRQPRRGHLPDRPRYSPSSTPSPPGPRAPPDRSSWQVSWLTSRMTPHTRPAFLRLLRSTGSPDLPSVRRCFGSSAPSISPSAPTIWHSFTTSTCLASES